MNARADDEQQIAAARAAQTKAMAARDHAAAASYWTEDVTMRRALGHALSGQAAYREMLEATSTAQNPIIYQRTATTVEVSDRWPLAFEEGRWSGHIGDASAQPAIAGRYAAQWVKRDGRWLIRSEVFVALTCEGIGSSFDALP